VPRGDGTQQRQRDRVVAAEASAAEVYRGHQRTRLPLDLGDLRQPVDVTRRVDGLVTGVTTCWRPNGSTSSAGFVGPQQRDDCLMCAARTARPAG